MTKHILFECHKQHKEMIMRFMGKMYLLRTTFWPGLPTMASYKLKTPLRNFPVLVPAVDKAVPFTVYLWFWIVAVFC